MSTQSEKQPIRFCVYYHGKEKSIASTLGTFFSANALGTSSTFPLGNHYNKREVALQQVLIFLLLTHKSVTVHNISELALLVESSSRKKNLSPLRTEIEATAITDTMLEYSKSTLMKMIRRQNNDVKLQGKVTFLYPISFHYYLMERFSMVKYSGLSKTPV